MAPYLDIDGEMQFDAAVSQTVAKIKCPDSKVAGQANVFVFPDISAGNIGYKIAARLGNFDAVGPILQGMNAPINDLSRGCTAEEVYSVSIVTAALSIPEDANADVDVEEIETIVRAVIAAMKAAGLI